MAFHTPSPYVNTKINPMLPQPAVDSLSLYSQLGAIEVKTTEIFEDYFKLIDLASTSPLVGRILQEVFRVHELKRKSRKAEDAKRKEREETEKRRARNIERLERSDLVAADASKLGSLRV